MQQGIGDTIRTSLIYWRNAGRAGLRRRQGGRCSARADHRFKKLVIDDVERRHARA
jgi:hypothetical protein